MTLPSCMTSHRVERPFSSCRWLAALAVCLVAAIVPDVATATVATHASPLAAPLSFASNEALIQRYAGALLADATPPRHRRMAAAKKTAQTPQEQRTRLENKLAAIDQKLDWAYTALKTRNKRGGGAVLITFGSIVLAGGIFVGTYVTIAAAFGGPAGFFIALLSGLALIGGGIAMITIGAGMIRRSSHRVYLNEKIRQLKRQRRFLMYDLIDLRKRRSIGLLTLPQVVPYAVSMSW